MDFKDNNLTLTKIKIFERVLSKNCKWKQKFLKRNKLSLSEF